MSISIQEHGNLLTSKVVGKFKEVIPVRAGFSNVFPRETTRSYYVDIWVKRGSQKIAVDVEMFTEGSKTKSTRSTAKKFKPPFYKLGYSFSKDDVFIDAMQYNAFGSPEVNKMIAENALDSMTENRDMIERAIRKQQADILQTGIVTLQTGDSIDYKRKPESMPALTGGDLWSAPTTATPIEDLKAGVKFLREVGHSGSSKMNCFMSELAFDNFIKTDEVKAYADFRRVERLDITMPVWNESTGMTFQGRVGAGALVIDIFTYNELYEESDSTTTQYYLDQNNIVILPDDFMGKTVFAALPSTREGSLMGTDAKLPSVIEAEYRVRSYFDSTTEDSGLELTSRPLVVPITIDKIFSSKVL